MESAILVRDELLDVAGQTLREVAAQPLARVAFKPLDGDSLTVILANETVIHTHEGLIEESLHQKLVNRLQEKENMTGEFATRVMNETLTFLKACGENPGIMLSPSEAVDKGWHNFLMYTQDYAEFCEREAGRFIHHQPADTAEEKAACMVSTDSFEFLMSNRYQVDAELWISESATNGQSDLSRSQTPPPVPQPRCQTPPPAPQPPRPTPPPGPGCSQNCSPR